MAGVGAALGAIGSSQFSIHVSDLMVYISLHETLARTTGQRVRLKIVFETKKESVAILEDIIDPGHILLSILQGMETRFDKWGH